MSKFAAASREAMSQRASIYVIVLLVFGLPVSAQADCPETPYHVPDPMWALALHSAATVASEPPSNYGYAIQSQEIAPLVRQFPSVKQYSDNGSNVFLYVLLRSAFCREILRRLGSPNEIDRRFRIHDVILAHDLGLSPY
jgi:hypothetical protein